jgi:predicted ATPase
MIGYLLGWYQGDDRLSAYKNELATLRNSALQAAATLIFKQAAYRPTLVVIDDLQWADEFSLQWLNALASMKQKDQFQTFDYKLLLLLTVRSQIDLPVESLAIDNILNLSPLDQVGRYELISHLLPGRNLSEALVKRISQESGGNPFYLEEATRGLIESGQLVRKGESWELTRPIQQIVIPPSIEGLVMANLDALNRPTRTVIQHASVIGLQFEFELLATITLVDDLSGILLELERRGFIKSLSQQDNKKVYEFTQILVHEVAYRSLLRKTRRELHERIAQLTETQKGSDDHDIEDLARHYAASGDQGKKLIYNWLAGQSAFERFDYDNAFGYLETAWRSLEEVINPNVELYINVANALGDVSTYTGRYEQAIACYEALHQISSTDPQTLGILIHKMARLCLYQLNIECANHYYQQALELSLGNSPLLTRIDAEIRILYDLG